MPVTESAAGASRTTAAPLCLAPAPDAAAPAAASVAAGAARAREAEAARGAAAREAGAARRTAGSPPSPRLQRAVRPRPKPAPPRPPAPSAPTPGYAPPARASGEWAFLDDKRLSIEEKLFRFMKLTAQKTDRELVDKMKEYKARFASEAKASGASGSKAKSGGTSLFGVLKTLVPALGIAEKVIGVGGLQKAAGVLGGPALAGLATAAGMPHLAPVALKYGGDLAQLAFKAVGAEGSSASGASGAAGEAGSPDERIAMMELQRLAEKQQQMFTAISNAMRAMHDTQMAAIHNIR